MALQFDEGGSLDPVAAMAGELIRMCAEMRRSHSVTVNGMVDMQERHSDAIEAMITSRVDQAETEAELELVSTLAEMDEEDPSDPIEEAAASLMEQVAGAMFRTRGSLTPAEAKRLLTESPDLVRQLAADAEVVGLFLGALQDPEPVPEEQVLPEAPVEDLVEDLADEELNQKMADPPPEKGAP